MKRSKYLFVERLIAKTVQKVRVQRMEIGFDAGAFHDQILSQPSRVILVLALEYFQKVLLLLPHVHHAQVVENERNAFLEFFLRHLKLWGEKKVVK